MRVIGAASASSGAATSISSTCWTMWTENSDVSYRPMPDSEREGEREHPRQERDRPPARDRVGGMGARRRAGRPTATSRPRRRSRASAAARTSSRGAARPRSVARPGPGRGRARAPRQQSEPESDAREAPTSRRVRWIERRPAIGGMVARTGQDDVAPTSDERSPRRARPRALRVEWPRFGPRAVDHAPVRIGRRASARRVAIVRGP